MISDKEVRESIEQTFSEINSLKLLEMAYNLYSEFWNEDWFMPMFHKNKLRICNAN